MIEEQWLDIPGYEGLYQISNFGRVKSFYFKNPRILKPHKVKGYSNVELYKNKKKKQFYIHRLVMENFCPIENMNVLDVNHKDEDKSNNHISNLEWMTHKDNLNYGSRAEKARMKMQGKNSSRSKKVRCIEKDVRYEALREAERQLGIPATNISKACKGKIKTAGGYRWEYVEEK